jgi:hypothetical protein
MSRNGSGTYTLPAGNPVVAGTTITSAWANSTLTDIATALTGSVAADGQTPMTGTLNLGTNRITGVANGTLASDAVNLSQLNDPSITGNVDILGTLHVVGATTLDSTLAVGGNSTLTGNLTVNGTGTSTIAGLLNLSGTGEMLVNVGTTAQRLNNKIGGFRYNSQIKQFEGCTIIAGQTISSITYVTTTATLTTATAHGLSTGMYVTISGTTPAAYSGEFVITVTGTTTFTYTMLTTPSGNATVVGTYIYGYWGAISGNGATGGLGNPVFYENDQTVTADYTITANKNAMSAGPITIDTGITVTVPTDSTWVIV